MSHTDNESEPFEENDDLDEMVEEGSSSFDAGDLGEESWDEDDQPEDAPPGRKKRKSGFFNLIVITLGVLAAVAFVYMKFMAGGPAPAPKVGPTPTPVAAAPAEVPAVAPPNVALEEERPADVHAVTEAPKLLTPMPDFQAPVTPSTSTDTARVDSSAEVPAVPLMAGPAADVPDPQGPVVADDVSPLAAPTLTAEPIGAVAEENDDRLKKIEDSLQDIVDRLSKTEAVAPADGDQIEQIGLKIKDLSDRLGRIEGQLANRRPELSVRRKAVEDSAPADPARAGPANTIRPTQKQVPSAKNWVLRAVSGGVAYIAPMGTGPLKEVRVGDTVAGLGQIQSIRQESGLWTITGTQGTVHQ